MGAWRLFADTHPPVNELPAEFCTVKGPSDPRQAEYSTLCRIQEMADSLIPVEMQRTMFAMMLAEKMVNVQQPSPSHRECAHRLHLYADTSRHHQIVSKIDLALENCPYSPVQKVNYLT